MSAMSAISKLKNVVVRFNESHRRIGVEPVLQSSCFVFSANVFFKHKTTVMEYFPRSATFLPWESQKSGRNLRYKSVV